MIPKTSTSNLYSNDINVMTSVGDYSFTKVDYEDASPIEALSESKRSLNTILNASPLESVEEEVKTTRFTFKEAKKNFVDAGIVAISDSMISCQIIAKEDTAHIDLPRILFSEFEQRIKIGMPITAILNEKGSRRLVVKQRKLAPLSAEKNATIQEFNRLLEEL